MQFVKTSRFWLQRTPEQFLSAHKIPDGRTDGRMQVMIALKVGRGINAMSAAWQLTPSSVGLMEIIASTVYTFLLRPLERWRIVMSASVCVPVCLFVFPRAYPPNQMRDLRQIFVHVAYRRGSVLLWQGDEIRKNGQFWGFSSPLTMHCTA